MIAYLPPSTTRLGVGFDTNRQIFAYSGSLEEGHRYEIHVGSPELLPEATSRWDLMGVSVSVRIEFRLAY